MTNPKTQRRARPAKFTSPSKDPSPQHYLPEGHRLGQELTEAPVVAGAPLHTFFLSCGGSGLNQYADDLTAYYHDGGRAVALASPQWMPRSGGNALRAVRILGRLAGDYFELAKVWARSNVLTETYEGALDGGLGTSAQRHRAIEAYARARVMLDRHDRKRDALVERVHAASVELVKNVGLGPVVLEHEELCVEGTPLEWDSCHTRERIYWRPRTSRKGIRRKD